MSESERLRVVSFNLWGLADGLSRHLEARMRAIGPALEPLAPDLVAFQECWTDPGRAALLAGLEAAGLTYLWAPEDAGGLAFGARRPLGDVRFTPYTLAGLPQRIQHSDWWGGKGFALATVATPAGPVRVLNTHLHAQYTLEDVDEYRGHRVAEIIEIASRLADETGPVIAMGDFNLRETDGQHAILTGLAGLRDAAIEADTRAPTILSTNPYRGEHARRDERIDYVFVRDGASARLQVHDARRVFDEVREFGDEPGALSDHAGILADIEIHPGGGSRAKPDPVAGAEARGWLDEGRERSDARARREALGGLAAAGGGAAALALRAQTRRSFLRGSLAGVAALGFAGGALGGTLAWGVVREERAGFDSVEATLDGLLTR